MTEDFVWIGTKKCGCTAAIAATDFNTESTFKEWEAEGLKITKVPRIEGVDKIMRICIHGKQSKRDEAIRSDQRTKDIAKFKAMIEKIISELNLDIIDLEANRKDNPMDFRVLSIAIQNKKGAIAELNKLKDELRGDKY